MEQTMNYWNVEPMLREFGKRQMVFGAFYCKAKPWLNHHEVPKEKRGVEIPLVMMQMRWDGWIGFPGGIVDPGESLYQALERELQEEINYFADDIEEFQNFVSFGTPNANIHAFKYEVNENEMKCIIQNATRGKNFLAENQGCFALQIAYFEGNRGIPQFLNHNFKATAKAELMQLVEELK